MTDVQTALVFVAALSTGLIAGTFFAFSVFVMRALGALAPEQGIAAMQSINVVVLNPVFLGTLIGTGVLSAILIVAEIIQWRDEASPWVISGSLIYVIGTLLVTMLCNVPMNIALARLAPDSTDARRYWITYLDRWTFWNTVRTLAALLALACFVRGLMSNAL